jgi:hypothetical protein
MKPAFPSLTFPNHWTLMTGLHPESHGIVGNTFYDPAMDKVFVYTDPKRSHDAYWWGGEPVSSVEAILSNFSRLADVGDSIERWLEYCCDDVAWSTNYLKSCFANLLYTVRCEYAR